MGKIIFVNNNITGFVSFRYDVVEHFASLGYVTLLVYPKSTHDEVSFQKLSRFCRCIAVDVAPNGTNLKSDYLYYQALYQIFKQEKPDIVFNYTIKPNIYGAWAAKKLGIKVVDMVAGLGYAFDGNSLLKKAMRFYYRYGLRKADRVIVLNQSNYDTLVHTFVDPSRLIHFEGGEGVNMSEYKYVKNEFNASPIFLFIARLMYDKGYQTFVDAAKIVKSKYPDVRFEMLGELSEDSPSGVPKRVLDSDVAAGYITYLGTTNDVPSIVQRDGVVVTIPSQYLEGMNRAIMEATAMGRPVITTSMPGCHEMVEDGQSGFIVPPMDAVALADACIRFIQLSQAEKQAFGVTSFNRCKARFDVKNVLAHYERILKDLNVHP